MKIDEFIKEVDQLGVDLTEEQLNKLKKFYELLIEWNTKINLTRITNKEEVYLKHFYDSITIFKVINLYEVETLCDIGTGAGFPGLLLKIIFPNLNVTLVDSLNKRVNYLNDIISKLSLTNIEAIHIRGEEYARQNYDKFDVVTARAVTNLKALIEICLPLVKVNGSFIAMKGNADEELMESKNKIKSLSGSIEKVEKFVLPIENSNRTLIKIKKTSPSNRKYPRPINFFIVKNIKLMV